MTLDDLLPRDSPDGAAVVRQRVADNLGLVVAALLLLAVVGGWVTYAAYVNPPTDPADRTVGSVETAGEYDHGATVRSENPVYPVGHTLQERRHYFHSITPILNGTFAHEYAANGTDVTVETTLALRSRSADSDGEYWSVTEPLADRRVEGAGAGGTVVVPFEVNVTEATRRIAETTAGLGGSPGDPELAIVAETAVSATVDGERVTTTTTHDLPIVPAGSTYAVGPAAVDTASGEVTRTVEVPREYGPVAAYGAVVLLLSAVALLGIVGRLHLQGSLRPTSPVRRDVSTARDRKALDEWITVGRLPSRYRTAPTVAVTSLAGLVDVAIDCNRRVIEDEERGAFFVVDGDVTYAFDPDADPDDVLPVGGRDEASTTTRDEFEWRVSRGASDVDAEFEWTEPPAESKEEF